MDTYFLVVTLKYFNSKLSYHLGFISILNSYLKEKKQFQIFLSKTVFHKYIII